MFSCLTLTPSAGFSKFWRFPTFILSFWKKIVFLQLQSQETVVEHKTFKQSVCCLFRPDLKVENSKRYLENDKSRCSLISEHFVYSLRYFHTAVRRRDCSPSFLSAAVGTKWGAGSRRTNSNNYADTHRQPDTRRTPPARPYQRVAGRAHRHLHAYFAEAFQQALHRHRATDADRQSTWFWLF